MIVINIIKIKKIVDEALLINIRERKVKRRIECFSIWIFYKTTKKMKICWCSCHIIVLNTSTSWKISQIFKVKPCFCYCNYKRKLSHDRSIVSVRILNWTDSKRYFWVLTVSILKCFCKTTHNINAINMKNINY